MIKLLYILKFLPGVLSLNICIVGSGPTGKLASIVLAGKGHNVSIYGKRETREINDSFNYLLSERATDILDNNGIEYKTDSKYTNKRINHYSHDNNFITYTSNYASISRSDLLKSMNKRINELDINSMNSELIHLDIDEKTIHMSHGAGETYDLLIGADGINSLVRKHMLDRFKSEMSTTKQVHDKTVKTMELDITDMYGYDPSWGNSVHIWNNNYDEIIGHPQKDGKISCVMCVGDGVFDPSYTGILNEKMGTERSQKIVSSSHVAIESVVLLGDSAHSLPLQSGEAINAAIEDCKVLGEVCDKHYHPYSICKNYNEKRVIDSHAIVEISKDITKYDSRKIANPGIPYSEIFKFNQD